MSEEAKQAYGAESDDGKTVLYAWGDGPRMAAWCASGGIDCKMDPSHRRFRITIEEVK